MAWTHQFLGIFLGLISLKVVQLSAFKVPKTPNSCGSRAEDFPRWESCCHTLVARQVADTGVLLHSCCSSRAVRGTLIRHAVNGFWGAAVLRSGHLSQGHPDVFFQELWVWDTLLKHKQKKSYLPPASPTPTDQCRSPGMVTVTCCASAAITSVATAPGSMGGLILYLGTWKVKLQRTLNG